MTETRLRNDVRRRRRDLGLSQEALGDRVGVSRHAIMRVERGRQVPSTTLALRLADVFGCAVKDVFRLERVPELEVRLPLPHPAATTSTPAPSSRVAVGRVDGRWAAHPLPAHATGAADAIVVEPVAGPPDAPVGGGNDPRGAGPSDPGEAAPAAGTRPPDAADATRAATSSGGPANRDARRSPGAISSSDPGTANGSGAPPGASGAVAAHGPSGSRPARVRPVRGMRQLEGNVLVAGCAPLLANLAHRVGESSRAARATWISAGSRRALDLLAAGMVHVAGVHLSGGESRAANVRAVRRRFPGTRMLVVNLTRWRQGFVVAARNPLGIRAAADLLRPDVRVVGREPGTGADDLFARLLADEGGERPDFSGPVADGHLDVARRVHCGAADAGVAIEGAALAWGLGFVPLVEEHFDLVVRADVAEALPASRFLDALDDPGFRAEAASLPGYDTSISGHASTLEVGSPDASR